MRPFWIIQVGSKCNGKGLYKRKTEGYLTQIEKKKTNRRGDNMKKEAETGVMQP